MKKLIIVITLLIVISSLLLAVEKLAIARLHFDGGGDWYNDNDIIPNIAEFLNDHLNTNFSIDQAVVKPSDREIFNYPFIFMTGHGQVSFSDNDAANLRAYLQRGGFLYVDDDYGMDQSFRLAINKVFPEKQFTEIPTNHPIFHAFYDFNNGLPKIHEHDKKRPQAYGIFADDGHLMVLYTYESNISDGWSNVHDNPQEIRELALKMGVNIFYYLMGT